jgi:hypothetical protein
MSSDISQIAEAFCSYRFAEIFPYIHDEIKWNIVGREELVESWKALHKFKIRNIKPPA